jgi:hypothetical protein
LADAKIIQIRDKIVTVLEDIEDFKSIRLTEPTVEEYEKLASTQLPSVAVVLGKLTHLIDTATLGPFAGAISSQVPITLYLYAIGGSDPGKTIIDLYDKVYAAILADVQLGNLAEIAFPEGLDPVPLYPYIGGIVLVSVKYDHDRTGV